ncbi:MAG: uridine kinase [Chloroflexi bacterium]|nr:uridine kinase [Chloroflexota bacterium]
MCTRSNVVEQLADFIVAVVLAHPVRVAIDGVDAAGKTMLANELTPLIEARGRPAIRASADGFHNPRVIRYQRGADSPEGYYLDSFDYQAIRDRLLIPLGPDGNRKYLRAVFDYRADAPTHEPTRESHQDAILLFDGIFLLRPELNDCWDFRIFVNVDFAVSVERAVARDAQRNPEYSTDELRAQYARRYVPGQSIYLQTVRPLELADVVIDNNDLAQPRFTAHELTVTHD